MVNTADPLAANLRFAYLLNEGSGTTITDRSGNGLNGTASGGPAWVTGPVGNNGYTGTCLDFDGADDIITTMDPVHPTAYTMAALCRLDTSVSAGAFVRTNGDPFTYSHLLAISAGHWRAYMYDGAQKTIEDPATHVVGEWVHVVATAKNGGQLKLYVNGVESAPPASVVSLWAGGDRWWIGRNGNAYAFWNGAIDHVYYWTRELSAAEIAALAANNYALFAPAAVDIAAPANAQTLTYTPSAPAVIADASVAAETALQTLTLTPQPAVALAGAVKHVTVKPKTIFDRTGPQAATVSGTATAAVNQQTIRHSISSATPYVPPADIVVNTGTLVATSFVTIPVLESSVSTTSVVPAGLPAVTVHPLSAAADGIALFGAQTLSESITALPVTIGASTTAEAALASLLWIQPKAAPPLPRQPWFVVPGEARGFIVQAESRGFIVPRETRGYIVRKTPQ